MTTYTVTGVRYHSLSIFRQPNPGPQIIIELIDEQTSKPERETAVVRLTVDEYPKLIADLQQAYSEVMQHALIEVAAGGCRTCKNTRRVRGPNDNMFQASDPCPVCLTRAEDRITKHLFLRRKT